MSDRAKYIDDLKGLAIIFMVMGHICQMSLDINSTPFNKFYTSFHMPIFMFMSGIFVYKHFKLWNVRELGCFIKDKFKRIILPWFSIGGLYSLFYLDNPVDFVTGTFGGYWFLPALFFCMICDSLISYVLKKISSKDGLIMNIVMRLCIWFLLIGIYYCGVTNAYYRGFIYHYPFFVFGVFFNRYDYIKNKLLYSDKLFTLALLFYLIVWPFTRVVPFSFNLIGFFSIIILIHLFNKYNSSIPKYLTILGKYSLEIYVFHRFFVPSLCWLGVILTTDILYFDASENFILILLVTLIISLPICFLSILFSKLVRSSNFLNLICFGAK